MSSVLPSHFVSGSSNWGQGSCAETDKRDTNLFIQLGGRISEILVGTICYPSGSAQSRLVLMTTRPTDALLRWHRLCQYPANVSRCCEEMLSSFRRPLSWIGRGRYCAPNNYPETILESYYHPCCHCRQPVSLPSPPSFQRQGRLV